MPDRRSLEELGNARSPGWPDPRAPPQRPRTPTDTAKDLSMATLYGTTGNDTLNGTTSPDVIYGYPEGSFPEDETGNDSLRGGDGNDRLYGGGGNDTLRGDAGGDELHGGDGDDVLYGGDGNDDYDGGAGNDLFVIGDQSYDSFLGGTGSDTIRVEGLGQYQLMILDDAAGVEVLDMRGAILSGNAYNNDFDFSGLTTVHYGGRALDLGSGNDDFIGHAGADWVLGGVGGDVLMGGGGNDTLVGGENGDGIDGGAGNDLLLIDGDDSDTLVGGAGTDTVRLSGATERYRLILDDAAGVERLDRDGQALSGTSYSDIFDFSGLGSLLGGGPRIDLGIGNDSYTGWAGKDAVSAGSGNDTLNGGAGADYLDGGSGTDSMVGGSGNDRYVVGYERDVVDEAGGSGRDLVLSSVSFSLGASTTVRGTLEDLTLTGNEAIDGSGNALANAIRGNGAANALSGGAGADTLTGGAGNDRLDGGTGADRMLGGTGNDSYLVDNAAGRVIESARGGGRDTVISTIDLRLADNVEALVLRGDAVRGSGNALANSIIGNDEANILSGAGGHDRLAGGNGRDRLSGDAGNDRLAGGSSNDVLAGGDGRDRLEGGAGADLLRGGAAADAFVFDQVLRSANVDHLADFDRAEGDRLLLDREIFAGLARGQLDEDAFHAGPGAADAEDRLIYDAVTGRLWYDSDGTGAAGARLVAVLDDHADLGADQIYLF